MTAPEPSPDLTRVPISYDRWYGWLSTLVGLLPSTAYLDLHGTHVDVQMGWAFRTRLPRSAIASASVLDTRTFSRGVHGFGGRWQVNGAGHGIVSIHMSSVQRAYVIGVPVGLSELRLSVTEPEALAARLGPPT